MCSQKQFFSIYHLSIERGYLLHTLSYLQELLFCEHVDIQPLIAKKMLWVFSCRFSVNNTRLARDPFGSTYSPHKGSAKPNFLVVLIYRRIGAIVTYSWRSRPHNNSQNGCAHLRVRTLYTLSVLAGIGVSVCGVTKG
jgi:hypothetical protein